MSQLVPQRKHSNLDDRLIPLINIVFLLLIFFLLAGQISNQQNHRIAAPVSSSEKPAQHWHWLLEMDADRSLRFNSVPLSLEQIPAALTALNADPSPQEVNGQRGAIKMDRALQAKDLDAVLDVLRNSGVAKATLLTKAAEQ